MRGKSRKKLSWPNTNNNKMLDTLRRFVISATFIVLSAYCANISDIKNFDPNYGKTWMFFPDGDGNPQIIDLHESDTNVRFTLAHEDPDSKITMWLYNKEHKTSPKLLKKTKSGENFTLDENFDSTKKTKIIIHGWKNNLNSDAIQLIKDSYLEDSLDHNVIAVDWGEMAGDNNYLRSAASTRSVGRYVATVIDHMVATHNVRLRDIHIIGHSLGAHTAGYAGMYAKRVKGKKVGRISGLDPAYPAFQDSEKTHQSLDPSDAEFVDVIHTCAGMLGHNKNLGHADFFPNGGKAAQPGCDFTSDFVGACSHGRSYRYFAESIQTRNGFLSFACNSWDDYSSKKCEGDPTPMGEATPRSTRGTYFLETTGGPRFARMVKIN